MVSTHVPAFSRPATPVPHWLRYAASYDTLEQTIDQPFQSRARPGRVFPMEFEFSREAPAADTSKHTNMRFASPEPVNNFDRASTTRNMTNEKRKGSALVSPEKDSGVTSNGVWDTYMEVATKADSVMLDGWNRSIDILLVFTGLFSAVLTTFIIQSYQQLIPDPTDHTNILLAQVVTLLSNGSSTVPQLAPPVSNNDPDISLVNGLWFAALSCSLSTTLISMLAKQWLQAYQSHESGSTHQRARWRQVRYMRLQAWHVPAIINALPLLLHVALLLFFAGLIVLLWNVDFGISIATWVICFLAYGFYLACIVLPFIYPGCPYYHPITGYLLRSFSPSGGPTEHTQKPSDHTYGRYRAIVHGISESNIHEDEIDALALAWLLSHTNDSRVRDLVLQGIASLPNDFSALHILRGAGATQSALDAFSCSFHRDSTADMRWHLVDPTGAELYCRAWLLTRAHNEQWPLDMLEPLWILQDSKEHVDAAAIASCAIAASSLDSRLAQWEVISYLGQSVHGHIHVSSTTKSWLLETIIDSLSQWEMPIAVIEQTAAKTVPILLQLLYLYEDSPGNSRMRCAAAMALYILTCGPIDVNDFRAEERRCEEYCRFMVQSLSSIVEAPLRFGVTEAQFKVAARLLTGFAPIVLSQVNRYHNALRLVVRSSLSKLFSDGRITLGTVADPVLADALHLIFPPTQVHNDKMPSMVSSLIENVESSTNPDIVSWSIRCLGVVLFRRSLPVIDAFVENDGVNVILRAAKTGVDTGRLQVDSLRALCAFIQSSTDLYLKKDDRERLPSKKHFDVIFQSDFFETLLSVLASHRGFAYKQPGAWWLSEAVRHWIPALTNLCRFRPEHKIWHTVVSVIADFAERYGEAEYREAMASLEPIAGVIRRAVPEDLLQSPMPAEMDGGTQEAPLAIQHVKFSSSLSEFA